MPVTIRDVAKAAGVSITTVSRALNGYSDVGEKTRRKVTRIAEELNYRPSAVARSLVMNQTRTVGLLVSELTKERAGHYFMFQVLYGMHDRLAELGYDLILVSTTTARQRLVSYLDFCMERRLDGVIVMGIRLDDPYIQEVVDSPLPSVVIDLPLLSDHCGYVMTDNVHGAKLVIRHLAGRGHRKIGFVNGHSQAAVSRDRKRGYEEGMLQAGLGYDDTQVHEADFTLQGGADGLKHLLQCHPDMTAVFFASDLMAIGGLQYARESGIRSPEELAIVGYDDIELAEFSTPRLTTIRQKRSEMGMRAAEMVVAMMKDHAAPQGVLLAPELVVRDTT